MKRGLGCGESEGAFCLPVHCIALPSPAAAPSVKAHVKRDVSFASRVCVPYAVDPPDGMQQVHPELQAGILWSMLSVRALMLRWAW